MSWTRPENGLSHRVEYQKSVKNFPWKTINSFTAPQTSCQNIVIPYNITPCIAVKIVHQANTVINRKYSSAPMKLQLLCKEFKALGHDLIAPITLKKLSINRIIYLSSIIYITIRMTWIPSKWQTARIIPLLKPTRSADNSASYRPISLLSSVVMILGVLFHPYLMNNVIQKNQTRSSTWGCSFTSIIQHLLTQIVSTFNGHQHYKLCWWLYSVAD